MRTLRDSITAADIPAGAQLVGGYIDGRYKWSDADWSRFPDAVHVRIATDPMTNDGQVLDVETGDATPLQAVIWVRMRRRYGADPSVYTSANEWPDVRAMFEQMVVPEPHYWIAQWDGVADLLDGAVAKQYADPPLTGGHYDASVVADNWPGVDGVTEAEVRALLASFGLADENKLPSVFKQLAELAHHGHGEPTPPVQP